MRIRLPNETTAALIPLYVREYEELNANWHALEKKAQLTAAADGAILSACVALLFSGDRAVPFSVAVCVNAAAIAVAISGVCALQALVIQTASIPAPGDEARERARRLQERCPEVTAEALATNQRHHEMLSWERACADLHSCTIKKAIAMKHAHSCLQAAGGLIAMAFLVHGFAS